MVRPPPLRLGVLGMSPGNGHPYSWSAIFNGYDRGAMASCPFPSIPEYLAERSFPEDGLGALAQVTHVWAQEPAVAEHIARASRILHVVPEPAAMIGHVDGLLLARDDSERHLELARPFLATGLPVYIDKPLAVSRSRADALLAAQTHEHQIYSCSALRYARELALEADDLATLGTLRLVEGFSPKAWDTYAVHVVEPIVATLSRHAGTLPKVARSLRRTSGKLTTLALELTDGLAVNITTTGDSANPIVLRFWGDRGMTELVFRDSFSAFRQALRVFVESAVAGTLPIPREETMTVVSWLELGAGAA